MLQMSNFDGNYDNMVVDDLDNRSDAVIMSAFKNNAGLHDLQMGGNPER